jgi:hypothetical protein
VHTLPAFRSEIVMGPWLREENRDLLKQTLRERKFDVFVDSIAKRVQTIRHNRIAHRLMDRVSGQLDKQVAGISLDELRQLFDATHLLFGALLFGAVFITLVGDLTPTTIGGKPQPTCLDTVLMAVLRDSSFVNMPERRGKWWPMHRSHMSTDELQTLNDLRRQVGLPEA